MFGRKILFLTAGYVVGNIVSSLYRKDKKVENNMEENTEKKLVEDFLDTQKNFLSDMEDKYLSAEQKASFKIKKKEFLNMSEKYFIKAQKIFSELTQREEVQSGKQRVSKGFSKITSKIKDIASEETHKKKSK